MHLLAVQGWIELGNYVEAESELESISLKRRDHPHVLEARWLICANKKEWEKCLSLARSLVRRVPDRPSGWIHLSFALHELKLTKQAWDNLFAVVERFPKVCTIPYNLACYGAQLGRLWEAEQWLKRAFRVGDAKALKEMALADADLKGLWNRIASFQPNSK